jgi:hypothetical protein
VTIKLKLFYLRNLTGHHSLLGIVEELLVRINYLMADFYFTQEKNFIELGQIGWTITFTFKQIFYNKKTSFCAGENSIPVLVLKNGTGRLLFRNDKT